MGRFWWMGMGGGIFSICADVAGGWLTMMLPVVVLHAWLDA